MNYKTLDDFDITLQFVSILKISHFIINVIIIYVY
jgi:hypothetical protein